MRLLEKTCRGIKCERVPIWIMRQAGRYLPEYLEVRSKVSMLEAIETAEIAAEITMMPMNIFPLDAAVIFADILNPLQGFGIDIDFVEGKGPVIKNPFKDLNTIGDLKVFNPNDVIKPTLKAIEIVRNQLDNERSIIGFSGAPFTLSYYMYGSSTASKESKNLTDIIKLMVNEPSLWNSWQSLLSEQIAELLLAQEKAGAGVVQLFDSWAGALPVSLYRTKVLPFVEKVINLVKSKSDIPIIYFCPYGSSLYSVLGEIDVDVLGVDWQISIEDLNSVFKIDKVIQGNLAPSFLFLKWEDIESSVIEILKKSRKMRGHIFNLGHGILPETPVENVKKLVDFVVNWRCD